MMNKNQIAKAIAMAMTGTAMSAAGISTANATTTTMYNGYKFDSAASNTDGWVYGGIGYNPSNGSLAQRNGIVNPNYTGPTLYQATSLSPLTFNTTPLTVGAANFIGIGGSSTPSTSTPFGYVGSSSLNWAVDINGGNQTAQISTADAQSHYGFAAEVDTGGGAWRDNGTSAAGVVTGWKHQSDIGLIRSDVTQNVTLNLTNLNSTYARFGITVFEGMDTNTGGYSHHGAWNNYATSSPTVPVVHPYNMDNPFGTTGLINKGYSDNVDSTATNAFTFTAQAGQVYSIYLGGVDFSAWVAGVAPYQLDITTSPVPVPAAVWLFGSALAGMGIIGRRKPTAA